jgi:hypothetical protein
MKKIILLVTLIGLALAAEAQLKTYITLEAGPQWSLIKATDEEGYFKGASVMSSVAGATLSQEILPNLSLSAGLYYQPYRDGINMIDQRPGQTRWTAYDALLIPFRVEYRIQISEFPVSVTPRLGYVYGLLDLPDAPYSASGILSAPDGTAFNYSLQHTYSEGPLHMLEVGMGLNLRFFGLWMASLNLSYMHGFTEPLTASVNYTGQGGPMHEATYSTSGNALSATLAFGIPVSNIWHNRDYRIASRIENSVYDGKPVERKGRFYVGGGMGSLWRLFNTTNPALGARPMEERGLFKYANLQAGGYFGYMLTEELGVDVGMIYQGSSTFYSVMVDHEVDFATKIPAPMFLELPLRIRYFYNLYQEKLLYVVYGGASLLTHFTSGTYNAGGGDFTYNSPGSGGSVNATTTFYASRASRLRPLLRLGTGLEYRLPLDFPLITTFYVNYMHGFVSADDIFVSNSLPETPGESRISYNGSGWSVDLGVKVPLRFGRRGAGEDLPERPAQQ